MIHSLQSKQAKGVILKIDFEKAFDSVSWDFVLQVLNHMGFSVQWLSWISAIFSSSRVSVLVNGAPTDEFVPSRGLRQGDPLSPLLFNLVGEAFSRLITKASDLNVLSGIALPRCEVPISHLQFADDVVMFLEADKNSIVGVKRVLQCFQIVSGLKINFAKSCLYGYSLDEDIVKSWANILGCSVGRGAMSYLGATLGSSPSNLRFWDPLIRKIKAKIESLDATSISIAGRVIILQSVMDNIPSYWLNLFKIPEGIVKQVELIRRRFLWGYKQDSKRKIHLLAWHKICLPKSKGGLGIGSMRIRNMVMLSRWWGKAYSQRGRGWNKLLSNRYGPGWNYDLNLVNVNRCSPIVKGIVSVKSSPIVSSVLNSSKFCWQVFSGDKVMFWEDWWINDRAFKVKFPSLYAISTTHHMSVKDFLSLWKSNGSEAALWVNTPNSEQQAEIIGLFNLIDPVRLREGEDRMKWILEEGDASTKRVRHLMEKLSNPDLFNDTSVDKDWLYIWKIIVPPKITIFLWKLVWQILPTRVFLAKRIQSVPQLCPWCSIVPETQSHLLWECQPAQWVWSFVSSWWSVKLPPLSLCDFPLMRLLTMVHKRQFRRVWHLVITAAAWSIWLARNELIFRNTRIKKSELEEIILYRVSNWGDALKILKFGNTPIWRVNPQGALAVHFHNLSRKYWECLRFSFDLICEVHGLFSAHGSGMGGIGGAIKDAGGTTIYAFSGPTFPHTRLEIEIIAILHLVLWVVSNNWQSRRSVICSDSVRAVNIVNHGVHWDFPHLSLPATAQKHLNSTIFIQFVPEELNSNAVSLASSGIFRSAMTEFWAPKCPT